ncbi:MAG: hypothetical protein SH859_06010 [Hyphomicrobium aestuarii]|nr:hypothetical protein [Hyphomicrobium aestuarii]
MDAAIKPVNAGKLSAILTNPQPLIDEIARLKTRGAPTVKIENRMPASGGEYLIGRDAELAALDTAWATGKTRLFVLDAMGGTGKTALINTFLANMANDDWRGAARVYCWSFYSQGTDDNRQGDADGFFDEALAWFAYTGEPLTNANRRGETLAELINAKKTLLVLDGLEPLQYPAGQHGLTGELKDDGLIALFKRLSLQMNGMAIVTTRIPLPQLKAGKPPAIEKVGLNQLATHHGVTLLKVLGLKAGEKELTEAVDLLKGHALSLNLLATYAEAVTGHLLPSSEEITRALTSPEVSQDSYVMMRRYEILFEDRANEVSGTAEASAAGRQLALLYLIGLFDRPAERAALDVLKADPIPGLTDHLAGLTGEQWTFAVSALRKLKLLLPETVPGEIDAHPLVREYFGQRLKLAKPEAFRAANLRLYEHYKLKDIPPAFHDPVRYGLLALAGARGAETFQQWFGALMAGQFPADKQYLLPPVLRGIAPSLLQAALDGLDDASFKAALDKALPDTVKGMEPLFSAIAHGCAAGGQDAAFYEVYFPRITRGNQAFAVKKLGAYGADLSALAHFFDAPFSKPSANLAEADQSLILGEAAFRLRALGRIAEAEAPLAEALKRFAAAQDWHNAANQAGNLSEVRLAIGQIAASVDAAREAVAHADAMADSDANAGFQRLYTRTTLADALHQAGALTEATQLFIDAEARQAARQASYPLLYSVQGARSCDLLLSRGDAADVRRRANKAIQVAQANNWLLDIALDTLSLGRAALAEGDLAAARVHLDAAVDGLHGAGASEFIPRGYLARAALFRVTGDHALAAQYLNDAADIADRSGMKLFRADIALERARLTLARAEPDAVATATGLTDAAHAIITDTGYQRRVPDVALVRAAIAIAAGNTAAAAPHLAVAKRWIDDGWGCHSAEYKALTAQLSPVGASSRSPPPSQPSPSPPPPSPAKTWLRRVLGG